MKTRTIPLIILITFTLVATADLKGNSIENGNNENMLIGVWVNKNKIESSNYIFRENNEFVYKYKWTNSEKQLITKNYKGTWEMGSWDVTQDNKNIGKTCNVAIYVDSSQRCLGVKMLGINLILTEEVSKNDYLGLEPVKPTV